MDIFDPVSDWKIYIPEKNIYIMKDHSWAFAAWEVERLKGTIKEESILFHIDNHLDDVPDGLFVKGVMTASTKDELFKIVRTRKELYSGEKLENKIYIDNFIWPSFARGTLGTMFLISPQPLVDFASSILSNYQERFDGDVDIKDIMKLVPLEKFKNVHRAYSFDEFKLYHTELFYKKIQGKSKILDLDLDYFTPDADYIWLSDDEIKKTLKDILSLCNWDLITVALSPSFCGGSLNAEHLLRLFWEVAELDDYPF